MTKKIVKITFWKGQRTTLRLLLLLVLQQRGLSRRVGDDGTQETEQNQQKPGSHRGFQHLSCPGTTSCCFDPRFSVSSEVCCCCCCWRCCWVWSRRAVDVHWRQALVASMTFICRRRRRRRRRPVQNKVIQQTHFQLMVSRGLVDWVRVSAQSETHFLQRKWSRSSGVRETAPTRKKLALTPKVEIGEIEKLWSGSIFRFFPFFFFSCNFFLHNGVLFLRAWYF